MARKEGDQRGYDRFRDRIMFPIRDRRGRVLGFGGRTLDGSHPKYLNSPETPVFHKGQELYGIYEARFERGPLAEAIVVEGYLDVIALMQFGVQNVVATLGTAVTEKHIERLFQQVGTLVFCFDGDRAGKSAAQRALSLVLPFMQAGRSVRFIFLPEGEDPDTFIRQQGASVFLDRVRTGVSLEDFLFEHVAMGLDLTAIDGRARLMALAKPLIAKMPPGVFRHMMYEKLEQRAGFSNTQQTPARRGKSGRLAPIPALRSPI
jgi:DNA primase